MLLPRTQAMPVLRASPEVQGGETESLQNIFIPWLREQQSHHPGPPQRTFQSTLSRAEFRTRTRLKSDLTARARKTRRNGLAPFQEHMPFDHFNGKQNLKPGKEVQTRGLASCVGCWTFYLGFAPFLNLFLPREFCASSLWDFKGLSMGDKCLREAG